MYQGAKQGGSCLAVPLYAKRGLFPFSPVHARGASVLILWLWLWLQHTLQYIQQMFLTEGPFDGVLGFGQGQNPGERAPACDWRSRYSHTSTKIMLSRRCGAFDCLNLPPIQAHTAHAHPTRTFEDEASLIRLTPTF
jgi:hypothetical protein